ncbi:MarR family winged helix-turn-helix transcriptional regulator [Oligoflexus tunisiensis]|uniref:MarR family winged helix-turn-helix transcriptional regulator n=1 Tax=Oligoflexus tunisiensis TaxID=708132 RepID=UPI001C4079D5|nr:MarR family winged helix-turn-helix transcriptional regulator [Oligoflexus tunisiensis]
MTHHSGLSVLNSVRRIVQALRISSRHSESQLGLSSAQLFVLQKLSESKTAVSMSELAAMTLTHISSVSVVVSRLADNGLVIKKPSPQDGRRMEVQVSEKGRDLLRIQPRTAQEELIAAVERLPEGERDQLARLLHRLVEEAGFSGTESAMFFEEGDRNSEERDNPR